MSRLTLTLLFSCASAAGLGLIAYGLLAGLRRGSGSHESRRLPLGFSDSADHPLEFLDLDMGHEGLKHREKERLDPGRYRPEPISSGKRPAEKVRSAGQENKACKIDLS